MWHRTTAFAMLPNPNATFSSLKVVIGVLINAFSMWGYSLCTWLSNGIDSNQTKYSLHVCIHLTLVPVRIFQCPTLNRDLNFPSPPSNLSFKKSRKKKEKKTTSLLSLWVRGRHKGISFHIFWFGPQYRKKSSVHTGQSYSSGFTQMWPRPQRW